MKNIKNPNKFNWGGDFKQGFSTGFDGGSFKDMFSGANVGKAVAGALPGITAGVAELVSKGISGEFSTTGGQILSSLGDVASMIPGMGIIAGPALKVLSGVVNRGFGTVWDEEGIANAENNINSLNKFSSGASDFDSLLKDINKANSFNQTIKASDLGKDGWFVNRTDNKANELNTDLNNAYSYAMRNANNVADNISNNTLANLERNYAAFGGPLFAYGGQTHGSDFTNGLMFIKNGGTHESNPYEGVPISMDQEGNPNLVEEGEVIWNDYVFSNRLKVPKGIKTKYKVRGNKPITFAEAVDKLSKESEERPNDPISMRGLESILMNMAIEQETLKSKQQSKNTKSNKFATGGPYSTYGFVPTYNNGWYNDERKYTQEYRNYVKALTKEQLLKAFNDNYTYYSDAKNKGTEKYKAIEAFYKSNPRYERQLSELSDDMFNTSKALMLDNKPGFMHHIAADMMNTQIEEPISQPVAQSTTANRYFIRNTDGTVTPMTDNLPFEGLNTEGRTWAELNPNYVFAGKQVREPEDVDGVSTIYTDYYYDPKEESTPTEVPYKQLPTWMRYAPAVGFGALSLSDALGITNKPDYSNADAVIKAVRDKATYDPIRFKPIGDYLAYNPFDTEYHANQLRAVAGANRRHIMNTSRGNRAAALTGILAADNNTMNQMGDLYRKTAEYNLEQKHKVGEFNKDTNKFNSEGFFKADAANQSAALQAREMGLEGLMAGYKMKEEAKLMSDKAKSANLSGLFQSLGDIGYENVNRNMINWGMANGVWAPSQWQYDPLTGKPIKENN